MQSKISVEVVYVSSEGKTFLIPIIVAQPITLRMAIEASQILMRCKEIDLEIAKVGIFSQLKKLDDLCQAGDRIEIYRPLKVDPKEARRKRAEK